MTQRRDGAGAPALPMPSPDPTVYRIPSGRRGTPTGAAMKRRWLVHLASGEEHVEADEVEILGSGVIAFYRFQSRRESERTLLLALAPDLWRRCQLVSDD